MTLIYKIQKIFSKITTVFFSKPKKYKKNA